MGDQEIASFWQRLTLVPIRIYRKYVSPALKPRCRYYPSCSEYFERAVVKYGVFKGSAKGIYRIMRCHPFAEGGYDPP